MGLSCLRKILKANYDCPSDCLPLGTACDDNNSNTFNDVEDGACNCAGVPCPETINLDTVLNICSGTEIDLKNHFNLPENVDYEGFVKNASEVSSLYIGKAICEIIQDGGNIRIKDANGCLYKNIHVTIITYLPEIVGTITHPDNNLCKTILAIECPQNYSVHWRDDKGNTGEGLEYIGTEGTTGFVEFTVAAHEGIDFLEGTNNTCQNAIFRASYDCSIGCPPSLAEDRILTVCGNETINIIDYLEIGENERFEVGGIQLSDSGNYVFHNDSCKIIRFGFYAAVFDNNDCLIRDIGVAVTIFPTIKGEIVRTEDGYCGAMLFLECEAYYQVKWEDSEGRTGIGNQFTGLENTAGSVTFHVQRRMDETTFLPTDTACLHTTFEAEYNCIPNCPETIFEEKKILGCHGDIVNFYEALELSPNARYEVDNQPFTNIEAYELINEGADCTLDESILNLKVYDENCLTYEIKTTVIVFPNIRASIVKNSGCRISLELACPDLYDVEWTDNLGNNGLGSVYEAAPGTNGIVTFEVRLKDASFATALLDEACAYGLFKEEFACCQPAGTICDDGNEDTLSDQEDGNCNCIGIPCRMEHRGKVLDYSNLDGCGLIIELSNGEILEPAIVPEDFQLAAGQEVTFSFIELTDATTTCQAGKAVEIICIEKNCPDAGTPCTDGDLATINDVYDANCNCIGNAVPEVENLIDLRFHTRLNCEQNSYCAVLQAKAQQKSFSIGTSSIMVNYNASALEFASYQSIQFDENETCIGGIASPWDAHKFDANMPSKFSLTLMLKAAGESCPEITMEKWEDIGMICFDIMDNTASPNLKYDTTNTHFNSNDPNDGSNPLVNGQFNDIKNPEALECPEAPLENNSVTIEAKVFLQGAYLPSRGQMRDDLRKKLYLPYEEPYTEIPGLVHAGTGGGETVNPTVFADFGDNSIVDWVFMELRSAMDSTSVVATRSVLLQKDGDIVDIDGVSPVEFLVPEAHYYVTVKHRNHLGVMTAEPILLTTGAPTVIDFTNPDTPTYGNHAQTLIDGKQMLWGGNANPDKYLILAGGGLALPDRDIIFFDIFLNLWYANPDGEIKYNSVLHGYYTSDTNLDGKVKYQGPKNDIDALIFF